MTAPIVPTHAATVVTVRDGARGFEIFMVKRHGRSGFMANAHVYPGGKLDMADTAPDMETRCAGVGHSDALRTFAPVGPRLDDDPELTGGEALGLYVAAIREVFEEAGLLMARTTEGFVSLATETARLRYAGHRDALNDRQATMASVIAAEDLTLATDDLTYFAHWITPVAEGRRFNTRFFLARAPQQQEALHDNRETVASAWWTPQEALDRYGRGEIHMAPPTLTTLEDMAAYSSITTLFKGMDAAPVRSILPRFETIDGDLTLLLAGDPAYPGARVHDRVTRIELKDGRWWSSGS